MKLLSNSVLSQSLLYGMSIALMKGVSLLILPFIAHQLTTEEFGRLEVISTLAIIGSILVGMGLEDTLFRFAGAAKSHQQKNNIAAQIFGLSLLFTFIALVVGWFSAATLAIWIPGTPTVYEVRLVLSVLALEGCIAIPLGWLRMNNRALSFFTASCGRALIQAGLVVLLLHWGRGVAGILEAGLIAALLQTLLLSYWQLRSSGIQLDLKTGKRALIYSLPIVGSGLIAFALNGLDRWILAEQVSLSDVAEFAIAAKFALATVLLLQPFGMWWSPRRFNVLNQANGQAQVTRLITLGAGLALLITIWVGLLAPVMINTLLPDTYQSASQYVLGLVIVMLLRELVELFNIGCFIGKTTNSQLAINVIAAIVGVTAMLLLTPIYQVWGVIFSLLLAQSIRLILFYRVSQYFLRLNYSLTALLALSSITIFWLLLSTQITQIGPLLLLLTIATANLLISAQALNIINIPYTIGQKRFADE
jgi:O-antigen/teichoic acid export membrane protein